MVEWRTGGANWNSATTTAGATSFQITGLNADTQYEWRVSSNCGTNGSTQAVQGDIFVTLSCPAPTGLSVDNLTLHTADLSWTDNTNANASYLVQWREQGATAWNTGITTAGATSYQITGLTEKTHYEWQVISDCGNNVYSLPVAGNNFYTWYCESVPLTNDGNGITNVQINGIDFSNPDVTYNDFTDGTVVDMDFNVQTNVYISFDTAGWDYDTNIWIDFNDNLIFDDDELVYSGTSDSNTPTILDASFTLSTPNVQAGQHIMRIGSADTGQNPPNPCYSGYWGVTLDFKVNILNSANIVDDLLVSNVVPGAEKANTDFYPYAEIINNGSNQQNDFDVVFTVMDNGNNIVFSDLVNVTGADLNSMEATLITTTTPVNLPVGTYTINANVVLSGDTNTNNNANSQPIDIVDFSYDSGKLYAYNWNWNPPRDLYTFDESFVKNSEGQVNTSKVLFAGTFIDDVLVGIEYSTNKVFFIDGNGSAYEYGKINYDFNGYVINDIAYDQTTGNIYLNTSSALYVISNFYTLEVTEVGIYNFGGIIAIDIDNNGNMYAVNTYSDKLYAIDKTTADETEIGDLGLNLNYSQDITFDPSDGELYGTLYTYDSNMGNYTGGVYKIDIATGQAQLLSNSVINDNYTIAAIYDHYNPVCMPPVDFTAENITATTADLDWTPGNNETSWEIEYGIEGFAHGSGTVMQVNTDNFQLTGLTPDTGYDVYIRSNCSADNSNWTGPVSFHTFCNVVYIAPYEATFENNGQMQDCWINDQNDELDWQVITGPTPTYGTGPYAAYEGDYYLYVESNPAENGDKAVIYTPKVDISGLTIPHLKFYYYMYGSGMDPDGAIEVWISDDDGANYTQIFVEQGEQGVVWKEADLDLSAYSGIVSFKISGIVSSSIYTYDNDFAIDNFQIYDFDDICTPPSNIITENYTNDSVDLSWTPGGNESAWQIEYGYQGFLQGTGTVIDVNDTSYTLTGLDPNASYDVYVRAVCGANPTVNNNSEWAGPLNFNLGFGCYGPSTFSDTTGDWISHVSLNTIDNSSGQGGLGSFENYKNISTELQLGTAYNISVSIEVDGNWNQQVWAFADWNHDCDFDDPDEAMDLGEVNGSGVVNAVINVPPDAVLGETVIRIIEQSAVDPQPYNMHESIYGETEDYTLFIIDTIPPQPDTDPLQDITAECEVSSLTPPTATDNSNNTVTVTHDANLPITTQGTTVVTWTYDDGNGNTTTQQQNVIIDDVTAPVPDVAVLPDITAECEVTSLTPPTATDNCGGSVTVTHDASLPITTQGTTVVTWTYDDGHGNTITQQQNVIIDDVTAPVPDIAVLPDITAECEVTSLTPPTATDACVGVITATHNISLPVTQQGVTVVTWTYDDGNGNSIVQYQNIIIDDVTAPVPDVAALPDVTAECEATLTPPTAIDNCAGTLTATSDVVFPVTAQGTTVVTWTYDDGHGNITTQQQNIIIDDVTAPVPNLTNLPDVVAECEVTSLMPPTATDNCSATVTVTHDASLPISTQGTTVVTWTYDDGNGNTITQQQNVIINDLTPPVPDVAVLPDITAECEVTSLTPPTATDACTGVVTATHNISLPVTQQGVTVVTWTYEDGNGNSFVQYQNIIIEDVTPPVPDVAQLDDIVSECEVTDLIPPTATDNCSPNVSVTHDVSLPVTTPGTTVVTWTFEDENGNASTQTQNIIITPIDNTVSQSNNVLTANASGNYTYQWGECSGGNFVPINGETGQSFTATQTGDYAVEISNGTCSVISDCIHVEVNGISITGISGFEVYPNPSTGLFYIEFPEYENTRVSIYDMTGKLILSKELRAEKTQIDIRRLARAVYILRVQKEGKFYNMNIIKE